MWNVKQILPGAVLAALLVNACAAPPEDVPSTTVERRDFVHKVTAEGTLTAVTVTPISVPHEIRERMRLAWLAAEGYVGEGDVVARFDPKAMQSRLDDGLRERRSTDFEVRKAKLDNRKAQTKNETDYEVADLELEHARRFQKTDSSAYSRQEIAESEIDEELAEERKEHAVFSRDSQEGLAQTEMDLLEIKRKKANLKIDQAKQALESLEVRAPHAGILSLKRGWRGEPVAVGEEMWPGQEFAEIPDLSVLEAQVYVLEADAGGLEVGKRAEVVLDADPDRVWSGKIHQVDPVAQPRFRGSPVQYFGVKIELDDATTIAKRPGQRLRATLYLAEAEDALVVPRQAVFSDNGEETVYVKNGGGRFTPRKVQVGIRSMGSVVVDEGLEEGDVVALRKPTEMDEEPDAKDGQGAPAAEPGDSEVAQR